MSHSYEDSLLIVGGGIAGSALARALQRKDLPFRIIERRRTPFDGGLAINLPGNAIQALSALGLREQIEKFGHPLRRREYRTARDKLLFQVDEDAFWGPALRPRSIRRSALLSMLAAGLPEASLLYNADVQSMTLHSTHAELGLADGTNLATRLVVGADGVRSTIRTEAFGTVLGPGHALLAEKSWRFMAPNPGVDCWTVWAADEGVVLLMPIDDREVYGWAAITRPLSRGDSPEALDWLTRQFPERVRRTVLDVLARPNALYHSPLEEVRLNRWHNGRAVLIGDAAHATAPVWAEGVALALEDAIVLARALSTICDELPALADFEAQRRSRVAHVQALTDAMSQAAKLPAFIRNALFPFIGPKRYRQTYEPLKTAV
ncbi:MULTISPECIES: FAD-dependent oxidoreductase [Bradyrhizobium]|uniref:FAD-dependent oxidoreductase n=1 Tax=Bradyrhizobium elkanii TaxID=29448 RepID=UPI00041FB6CA|nr:NAD(P)/FAD-dependent oxidoreductase [Bradyrhizobium elkanii]